MANALNYFPCSLIGGNTGFGNCTIDIKNIVGAIIVPHGVSFSQAQTLTPAAFITALQAMTLAVQAGRAYPIKNFEEIKDNSEAPVEDKLGYGGRGITREGYFDWSFQILKGGFCLSKALRAFNGQNVDVFFVDANNLVFGIKNTISTGVVTFIGINQAYVYQNPFKINDGAKLTQYIQKFVFKPDFIDRFGGMQLAPGDFDQINGLQNVYLSTGGARVANVSKWKGNFSCGGASLGVTYGALITGALVVARDSVSGNVVAATSNTYDAATDTYTLTLNTADANYVAGNPVIISLADALTLNTAGILAVESNSFVTPN